MAWWNSYLVGIFPDALVSNFCLHYRRMSEQR